MSAQTSSRPALAAVTYYAVMLSLACYFTFAAVQGDYGLFRRVEIEAETTRLQAHRDAMAAEVVRIQNLTVRLSDDQLDLDLLDERARTVLGRSRVDEIIIR